MQIKADTPEEYIGKLPADRREAVSNIRKSIRENLPTGFEETITYGLCCTSFGLPGRLSC